MSNSQKHSRALTPAEIRRIIEWQKKNEGLNSPEGGDFTWLEGHYRELDAIDKHFKNGEGEIPNTEAAYDLYGLSHGTYKWVRIYDGRKAIATIYIRLTGIEIDLLLARARKGLPPNPADLVVHEDWNYRKWLRESHPHFFADTVPQEERRDSGAESMQGVKPTMRVAMTTRGDMDFYWQFPGFKVKDSKLGSVLFKLREAGMQRVQLPTLQRAIQLHSTGHGLP